MTITITIDGIGTTVDLSPYGDIADAGAFVAANFVPVAHLALGTFLKYRMRQISIPESLKSA